jgi:alkaline phosphatase
MRLLVCLLLYVCALSACHAQGYTAASIFAHNDYVQPVPFYVAYGQEAGYIEADIFLVQGKLLVAHTDKEIDPRKTLEDLYLKPLNEQVGKNKGTAYADPAKTLTLMIDLKSDGITTLRQLVLELKKYPKLLTAKNLTVTVSGNVPEPARWKEFPAVIHFDGRPGVAYTPEQLARVALISTSFADLVKWNGKATLAAADRARIEALLQEAHGKGKKLRFWATPDFSAAWLGLMDLKIDILNTDHVSELNAFLKNPPHIAFRNEKVHAIYKPKFPIWKNFNPKNIILLIGDGTGLAQWYTGYTANHGQLNIFQVHDIGFSVTTSSDSYITDSAAGATAWATGHKTNNRFISVDSVGKALPTIAEKLKLAEYRTAIISAGDITDATPACFYAHQPDRGMSEAIAADFMSSNHDILIGGGTRHFSQRKDGRNFLTELEGKGYAVATEFSKLDNLKGDKIVVLDDSAVVSKMKGRGEFLTRSLQKALGTFSQSDKPFFVMAEAAQIDWGGHANNIEYVAREVLDFDQAIGEAMKFVDENRETLLIVTADHETGGISLIGGDMSQGRVLANFATGDHTGIMVPVFAYGPGAEWFRGVYQNTAIYQKMLIDALRVRR